MPDQLRELHILTLRALDARQCGESYRTIAEVLLGFRGTKTDWEGDPRKNKARRLVASGQRLMRGGYRTLLHSVRTGLAQLHPSIQTLGFRGAVSACA